MRVDPRRRDEREDRGLLPPRWTWTTVVEDSEVGEAVERPRERDGLDWGSPGYNGPRTGTCRRRRGDEPWKPPRQPAKARRLQRRPGRTRDATLVTYGLSWLIYDIQAFNISVALTLTFQCQMWWCCWTPNIQLVFMLLGFNSNIWPKAPLPYINLQNLTYGLRSFTRYKPSKKSEWPWHWPFKGIKAKYNCTSGVPYKLSYYCLIVTYGCLTFGCDL